MSGVKKYRLQSLIEYAKSIGIQRKEIIGKDGQLLLNSKTRREISNSKSLTKKLLCKSGFKVPKEYSLNDKIKFPVVVKPDKGSKGNMVFVGVQNDRDLRYAIKKIKKVYKKYLIEEFVEGEDYRFLVLDGKVIAVAKRTPPYVIGDGRKKIKNLIEENVKNDWEIKRYLKNQNLTLNSVLASGQKTVLRGNSNKSTGGIVENVTPKVSKQLKNVAVRATGRMGLRIAGVDMICKDIRAVNPNYKITEINSVPGFGLHTTPDIGKPINPFPLIIKAITKK